MALCSTVWQCGFGPLLLWRVTCGCGPGRTNAGAKSIFRCEENLNAARRWWGPSPSLDLRFFSWKSETDIQIWCKAWNIKMTICVRALHHMVGWQGDQVHLWQVVFGIYLYLYFWSPVFLLRTIWWVQLWSLVPFSFKTAPPLRLQRCKNTPAAKNTMGSQQCRMDCCKLHKLKR